MKLGIFTHYLPGTVEETARRARAHGFDCVQLNLEFQDWRFEPGVTTPADCHRVRDAFHRHGLEIAAIAGYVNPVAPDPAKRRANIERLTAILRLARDLGSPAVATESGTLHPDDDWAPHVLNDTPAATTMLVDSLRKLTARAEEADATLLLEPSVGNLIDTPDKARRILATIGRPALGLVADPANFIDGNNIDEAPNVLAGMYDTLGEQVGLAHAKDFRRLDHERRERHHHPGDPALYGGVEYPAAGLGDMDYDNYLRWLATNPIAPPLIIEHIDEADVPRAKAFIDRKLAGLGG